MSYQCDRCGQWIFRNESNLEKRRELMAAHWHAAHGNAPLSRLRHHVSGAIERGEKEAIVAID